MAEDKKEEHEKIIRDGSDADFILKHAFVDGFLNEEANKAYVDFMNLSTSATHIECLGIICRANAIRAFRHNLRQYIAAKEGEIIREQQDSLTPEIDDI